MGIYPVREQNSSTLIYLPLSISRSLSALYCNDLKALHPTAGHSGHPGLETTNKAGRSDFQHHCAFIKNKIHGAAVVVIRTILRFVKDLNPFRTE